MPARGAGEASETGREQRLAPTAGHRSFRPPWGHPRYPARRTTKARMPRRQRGTGLRSSSERVCRSALRFGIDAPEPDQLCRDEDGEPYRCGQKASNALFDFIDRRPVECVEVDRDRYKRAVSVCTVGGTDIADWLVRNGLALDWPQYSNGGYADAQAEAKREQRGMWAGSFKEPWNYRACKRSGGRPQSCSDD